MRCKWWQLIYRHLNYFITDLNAALGLWDSQQFNESLCRWNFVRSGAMNKIRVFLCFLAWWVFNLMSYPKKKITRQSKMVLLLLQIESSVFTQPPIIMRFDRTFCKHLLCKSDILKTIQIGSFISFRHPSSISLANASWIVCNKANYRVIYWLAHTTIHYYNQRIVEIIIAVRLNHLSDFIELCNILKMH